MIEVKIIDGVATMTEQEYNLLNQFVQEKQDDIKAIKNGIFQLLDKIGMIKKDGSVSDKMDMRKVMGVLTSTMMQSEQKTAAEFAFLGELIPLIEKYKDL